MGSPAAAANWMMQHGSPSQVGASDGSVWELTYGQLSGGLYAAAPSSQNGTLESAQMGAPSQSSHSSSARLKPFIDKLYSMLLHPNNFRDCLVWDEGGTCFIVSHGNPRLLNQVLPNAFGHSNLHSFTSEQIQIRVIVRLSQRTK